MNANGAPLGPPTPPLPKHNPELLKASISKAHEFYRYDSQLNQADRQRLSSFFWQRLTFYPILGIPVVVGFIMAPNALRKQGILNPQKKHRLLQVGLGFFGLGVGFKFGGLIAQQIHTSKLADNEPARQSYLALAKYPPQLGSKYYALTAQYPELAFKDPETIDWKKSPIFPICLILNKDVIQHFRNLKSSADNRHFERMNGFQGTPDSPGYSNDTVNTPGAANTSESNTPFFRDSKSDAPDANSSFASPSPNQWSSKSENIPLTGTSWDNVLRQNQKQSASNQLPPAATPTPASQANWWDSNPSAPQTSPESSSISEEQRKFDELLEKERETSMQDSFSDSEKKW